MIKLFALVVVLVSCMPAVAEENMFLHGTLVQNACTLLPEDEYVSVDFKTIANRDLYSYTRTPSKPFSIRFIDCDTSVGNIIKIKFTGTESKSLPGLLALDAGSKASGIAIGLQDAQGAALPLRQTTVLKNISNGNNVVTLKAYVEAEPGAISQRNIKEGSFSAVANFTIEYE